MYSSKKGFTLAEVLITLLVIGVVASMFVPAIINDTNETEYNQGIKKVFADLSNAIKMIQVNNGGVVNVGNGNHLAFRNDFCSVMTCVKTDTVANIFCPTNYKYYKGGFSNSPTCSDVPAAILSNGLIMNFLSYTGCNNYGVNACGFIHVDINGKKGPNMFGKDFYSFWVVRPNSNSNYLILPYGTQHDTYVPLPNGCQANSSALSTSEGCTTQRLYNPNNMP